MKRGRVMRRESRDSGEGERHSIAKEVSQSHDLCLAHQLGVTRQTWLHGGAPVWSVTLLDQVWDGCRRQNMLVWSATLGFPVFRGGIAVVFEMRTAWAPCFFEWGDGSGKG